MNAFNNDGFTCTNGCHKNQYSWYPGLAVPRIGGTSLFQYCHIDSVYIMNSTKFALNYVSDSIYTGLVIAFTNFRALLHVNYSL